MVCSYGGLEHCQVEKLIMVAWAIWTNRNERRHGGVKKTIGLYFNGCWTI